MGVGVYVWVFVVCVVVFCSCGVFFLGGVGLFCCVAFLLFF